MVDENGIIESPLLTHTSVGTNIPYSDSSDGDDNDNDNSTALQRHQIEDKDKSRSSPICFGVIENNHGEMSHVPSTSTSYVMTQTNPPTTLTLKLPLPLRLLFAMNGITLALPSMALIYIVNTRVQLPLSLLPSYGAIAFLPFSLKPLYAVLSERFYHFFCDHYETNFQRSMPFYHGGYRSLLGLIAPCRRSHLLSLLLLAAAACTLGTAALPAAAGAAVNDDDETGEDGSTAPANTAIILCCFVALLRGVTSAWPEFLLGLGLLDEVQKYHPAEKVTTNGTGPLVADDDTHEHHQQQNALAALFQSQAATARNGGSLLAHTCVVFFFGSGWIRAFFHSSSNAVELDDTMVWILLGITAFINCAGAWIAWYWRVGDLHEDLLPAIEPDGTSPSDAETDGDISGLGHAKTNKRDTTTIVPLSRSSSFFEGSEQLQDLHADREGPEFDVPLHFDIDDQDQLAPSPLASNVPTIVLLQVSVMLVAMKQPIETIFSPISWTIMLGSCLGLLLFCNRKRLCRNWTLSCSLAQWQDPHRVGIFLILRHSIPSVAYLMDSYIYSILGLTSPILLQMLSLLDMVVTTISSWSFGKLLVGAEMRWLIAGTTTLAAFSMLLYLGLLSVLRPMEDKVSDDDSNGSVVTIGIQKVFVLVAIKIIVAFTSEWKFLPDVILATVSAIPATPTASRASASPTQVDIEGTELVVDSDRFGLTKDQQTQNRETGLVYGTLMSCIDFGGQLGALAMGPLISLLGTTRDNNWAHFELLIHICAIMTLLSIGLVAVLPPKR